MAVEPQIVSFWVVWKMDARMPRYKHATKESAILEAKRVSVLEKCPVHIIECVGCAVGEMYFPVDPNEPVQ